MQAKCVSFCGDKAEFTFGYQAKIEVGKTYTIEEHAEGSENQNRAFHALILELLKTGLHSWSAKTYPELKEFIKRDLGEGFDKYVYAHVVDSRPVIVQVEKREDIPEGINDLHAAHGDLIRGRLKSWTNYTKKQRTNCIDSLIKYMVECGVNTKKFEEILRGMES